MPSYIKSQDICFSDVRPNDHRRSGTNLQEKMNFFFSATKYFLMHRKSGLENLKMTTGLGIANACLCAASCIANAYLCAGAPGGAAFAFPLAAVVRSAAQRPTYGLLPTTNPGGVSCARTRRALKAAADAWAVQWDGEELEGGAEDEVAAWRRKEWANR